MLPRHKLEPHGHSFPGHQRTPSYLLGSARGVRNAAQTLCIVGVLLLLASTYHLAADLYKLRSLIDDATMLVEEAASPPGASLVAVIMETHPANNANLIPIMLQFAAMLGPRWPIVLLTSRENWSIPRSLAFRRLVDAKRISIMFLPNGTSFPTHDSVSEWLASSWLWEQFENSDRMLMFQSDSVLCSKSSVALDDFLEWDLIGAPINPIYGQGYNGGLSLRNTKMMLNITRANSIDEKFEDQWFYHQAMALGAKLPPVEVASRFSVETVWAEEPLGYHQPHRWWQGDQIAMIESWCPETLLIKGPGRFHQ